MVNPALPRSKKKREGKEGQKGRKVVASGRREKEGKGEEEKEEEKGQERGDPFDNFLDPFCRQRTVHSVALFM